MDRSAEELVDQIRQGERACAALDRTVRELRRLQQRAGSTRSIPALARALPDLEARESDDAPFGSRSAA